VAVTTPSLNDLRKYLLAHGWTLKPNSDNRVLLLESKPDQTDNFVSVVLPASAEYPDAAKLIEEAIRVVAEYENISIQEMVKRLHCRNIDLLRIRVRTIIDG
jgi:hypothetical protein